MPGTDEVLRGGPMLFTVTAVGPSWFTIGQRDGRTWHWGPWRTQWAADRCAQVLRERAAYEARVQRARERGDR